MVKDEHPIAGVALFPASFSGLEKISRMGFERVDIPREWLKSWLKNTSAPRDGEINLQVDLMLMEKLRERLAEQKGRHQGGSKWIGTAGTSPWRLWL